MDYGEISMAITPSEVLQLILHYKQYIEEWGWSMLCRNMWHDSADLPIAICGQAWMPSRALVVGHKMHFFWGGGVLEASCRWLMSLMDEWRWVMDEWWVVYDGWTISSRDALNLINSSKWNASAYQVQTAFIWHACVQVVHDGHLLCPTHLKFWKYVWKFYI